MTTTPDANVSISAALFGEIAKEVNEYPDHYSAHNDSLADEWDQAEAVNRLLGFLRRVVKEVAASEPS